MSQHADLLQLEVAKGIQRGHSPTLVMADVQALLFVLEYDDSFTSDEAICSDVLDTAKYMLTQRDRLYSVSHTDIRSFIADAEESVS